MISIRAKDYYLGLQNRIVAKLEKVEADRKSVGRERVWRYV